MNKPILIITIGYIIGIIWGLYLQISIALLYAFLVILYLIINYKYRKKEFKILSISRYFRYIKLVFKVKIILIIIISSFTSNIIIKNQNQKYEKIYNKKEIELIGIIISNKEEKEYKNRYKIKTDDGINFYIYTDKHIMLEYGDKVKIEGMYQQPQSARNYKGFNYKEYLKTIKIYGTIKIENIEILRKDVANPIMQISNNIFIKIKNNIEKTFNRETEEIILGIMLGYTKNIDEEIKEQFSESSLSHVLAVSGMHVSYIIFLISNSTKLIFGKRKSKIISSIVLILYMCITGFNISVVRACIMGIISCMSFVLYRKNDTTNNIAISMLIILINNPFAIMSLSFLLSYGGTLGILIFKTNIEKILKSLKIRNGKWKYVFMKIQRKCEPIIEILSVSISAQIVIIPIIVWNFNTIGISFLITNLLLNLVIGIIISGGFIQILISFISLKIGKIIAIFLQLPTYILIFISEMGSKVPFGNVKVITPDLIQIIFYYILILIINYLYKIFHKRNLTTSQTRIKNLIHVFKFKIKPYKTKNVYIIISIIIFLFVINKIPKDLQIYFIDVGQGDATLIKTPKGKNLLIDGGGSTTYDIGENTLVPYLLDRKIKHIDYLIVSHYDFDHVGALFRVLEEVDVKNVITAKQFKNSDNYERFLQIVTEKEINIYHVNAGDKINIENKMMLDIIWPYENKMLSENPLNNNSLVCKLKYEDLSILFTGDIEKVAEKQIINLYKDKLHAEILKIAHHGSKTSSIKEFIEQVNPKIGLIGVGENNKFGHPNIEVIENFKNKGCKIYRTDICGEIIIKYYKKHLRIFTQIQ